MQGFVATERAMDTIVPMQFQSTPSLGKCVAPFLFDMRSYPLLSSLSSSSSSLSPTIMVQSFVQASYPVVFPSIPPLLLQQPARVIIEQDTHEKRIRFAMVVSILLRYLQTSGDESLYEQAKALIAKCTQRHRRGDKQFSPLPQAISRRLRILVGDSRWDYALLAERQHHHLQRQQQQQQLKQLQSYHPSYQQLSCWKSIDRVVLPNLNVAPSDMMMVLADSSYLFR